MSSIRFAPRAAARSVVRGPGRWLLALLLASGVLGAADRVTSNGAELVWPRPPAAARIRYVGTIETASDWGVTPGVIGRLVDMFTGTTPLRFVRPTGVAVRGNVLYVADPGLPALVVLDGERNETRQVSAAAGDPLLSPVAVALGPGDSVFVADSARASVIQFDREGRQMRRIAHPELKRPAAAAYDAQRDRLYVADSLGHRLFVFSGTGESRQAFGRRGSGDGEFNAPTHVVVDGEGNLLVTDALNHRIQAFDPSGRFLWKLGRIGDGAGSFAAPKGVAVDGRGRIYVADALFDAVQVFNAGGELLLGFGERGSRPGQFSLPGGLAFDGKDVLYVADSFNHRIQRFERVRAGGGGSDE